MTTRYTFVRPLLAPDQSWAAVDLARAATDACAGHDLPPDFAAGFGPSSAAHWPVLARHTPPGSATDAPAGPPDGYGQHKSQPAFVVPLPPAQADDQAIAALARAGATPALWHQDASSFQALIDGRFPGTAWDVVDAQLAQDAISPHLLWHSQEAGRPLVGLGVDSRDRFDWCAARGFTLLGAEFVSHSDSDVPADPSKLKLLRLVSLVIQDAPSQDLEEIFRGEPKLLYNLLRLVNSVSVGGPAKVASLSQALMLLGRRQLQRWLQLLIYANQFSPSTQQNPLLKQAAYRGSLLDGLCTNGLPDGRDDECPDCAYMVGVFSLLPTLLRLSMADILNNLPLPDQIGQALLDGAGPLGWGLRLVTAAEQGRLQEAGAALAQAGIPADTWLRLQQRAFGWTSQLEADC